MHSRRHFLRRAGTGLLLATALPGRLLANDANKAIANNSMANNTTPQATATRAIPSSGEALPVIGMGTWLTFNVGNDPVLRNKRTEVLQTFFEYGGGMIDCSPMYGSSADVLGYGLQKLSLQQLGQQQLGHPPSLFSADKVWTRDGDETRQQTATQTNRWGTERMDLMQVHNLLNWQQHLPTLAAMKAEGVIRYLGVTTSHTRRHDELEQLMTRTDLDFVQLTYNIGQRTAEQRLLPLAREKGIAVIANRPYAGGALIKSLKRNHSLPHWLSAEYGYQTWADLLLGFVVSHPAVTCAIPATTQVAHMHENMQAGTRPQPDEKQRQRLIDFIKTV